VVEVYVEDIEAFTEQYTKLEKDEERVDRFLRSKAGEMVTDYYSEDPSLNIVQIVDAEELARDCETQYDKMISILNGFGWPSDYYFRKIQFEIRWMRLNGDLYKLVKTKGEGCYAKVDFMGEPCRRIRIYGNPFWIYWEDGEREAFLDAHLESYVWHVAEQFETEEEFIEDQKRNGLTQVQIQRILEDLPGDAG
jgi:hypothetical protein